MCLLPLLLVMRCSTALFSAPRGCSAPPPLPLPQSACKPDFYGVLCAANGVAHTLAGAPARCLHLEVPALQPGSPDVCVTAAYLEFKGTLWVVLSEGAEVNEASAGVGALRLLDACVALLGVGVVDQAAPLWADGTPRDCTDATLARTLRLLSEGGDFEYNVLRPDWLAHAYVSAEAAAQRSVREGAAIWEFRSTLLNQLEILERDVGAAIAEGINRRTHEVMAELLSRARPGDSAESDAIGEMGELPSPSLRGSFSPAAAKPASEPQKIRCLRRLRLSVQGSAIALATPTAAPAFLVDRVASNGAAALLALALATAESALFAPPAAPAAQGGAEPSVRRSAVHLFCPPPPPPPSSTSSSSGSSGGGVGEEGTAAAANKDLEDLEVMQMGAGALEALTPPCSVLSARGILSSPCSAADRGTARVGSGKLHVILAAVPLPPYPSPEALKPPPPETLPRPPMRLEETAAKGGRSWGGACTRFATRPHALIAVVVLQPPAPAEENEPPGVAAYADAASLGALSAAEEHAARAVLSVARASAMVHLGALLEERAREAGKQAADVALARKYG